MIFHVKEKGHKLILETLMVLVYYIFNSGTITELRECAHLSSPEMGHVLVNLVTQLGGNLEDGVVVLHHEGHKFGCK